MSSIEWKGAVNEMQLPNGNAQPACLLHWNLHGVKSNVWRKYRQTVDNEMDVIQQLFLPGTTCPSTLLGSNSLDKDHF